MLSSFSCFNVTLINLQVLLESEWSNFTKLYFNYVPMPGVPQARRQSKEYGFLNTRPRTGKMKMKLLRGMEFSCFEKMYCIDIDRSANIVTFPQIERTAFFLDPTIHFES